MKKAFKFCLHLFIFCAIAGMVVAFGKINVVAATPTAFNSIDSPSSNQSFYNSNVTLSGWALNSSGIQRVDVYINGHFTTSASASISRPDVASAYSGYNFPGAGNSGFSCTLPNSSLTPGTKEADLAFIGNNGSVQWSSVKFSENKPSPASCIDSPYNNQTFYSADISLSGWALNASGISRADVYIDGSYKTSIATFISRPDVAQAYSSYNYQNAVNSGFSYIISNNSMSPGTHEADIAFIGNDGSVQWKSVNFNVSKSSPVSNIDTPYSGQNFNNSGVTLSGWALNSSGVSRADVYVDGSFRSSVTSFTSRPDVAQAYSSYGYSKATNSGFSYTIPSASLTNGTHEADIAFIGNDGSVQWQSVKFTENIPPAVHSLDAPNSSQIFNNADVTFSGWALNASGISRIDVYLNGNFYTSISSFYNRPDVANVYGKSNYANINSSGFSYTIPRDTLQAGTYQASLAFIGNDGTVQWSSVQFTENKAAPKIYIDGPSNGQTFNNTDDITVNGWAVNASSISRVDFLLDGSSIGTETQFSARPDVNSSINASGAYENGLNSGFSINVPISRITTLGNHVFTVAAYGKDGSVITATTTIITQNIISHTSYNISLSTLLSKQNVLNVNNNYVYGNIDDDGHQTQVLQNDMDPLILSNDTTKTNQYQFLDLEWHGGSVTAAQLETMILTTGWNASDNKYEPDIFKGHAQAFIDAAKAYNINPVYLVAHARIESGNGTSTLAKGQQYNGTTYYNMYGIGAYDGTANSSGLIAAYSTQWVAPDGTVKTGWKSVDDAIIGGAAWISLHYVNSIEQATDGSPNHYDQKTLYEMKWDPYWLVQHTTGAHQYATDINWSHEIAAIINQNYLLFGNDRLTFIIPKYN